jgi:hypothetical protein
MVEYEPGEFLAQISGGAEGADGGGCALLPLPQPDGIEMSVADEMDDAIGHILAPCHYPADSKGFWQVRLKFHGRILFGILAGWQRKPLGSFPDTGYNPIIR